MNVLVTGGAGYIGSVLVGELLDAGHDVAVVDNFMYRQTSLLHLVERDTLTIVRADARDRRILRPLLAHADAVIPLACLTGMPACDQDMSAAITTNLQAIRDLMADRSPAQLVLYPNTNSGYGQGGLEPLTEDAPFRPQSLYAKLKLQAEQAVLQGESTLSFRLATAFGPSPRMRLDLLVNDMVHRAVTDGFVVLYESAFRRNFVHVRDVARLFRWGLDGVAKHRVYNFGLSAANLTKRQLCEEIRQQVPRFQILEAPALDRDRDRRDYLVDNARIEAEGMRAEIPLSQGIAELIQACEMLRGRPHANA